MSKDFQNTHTKRTFLINWKFGWMFFYSRQRINISFAGQKGLSYYYAGDPFKVNLFLWWKGGEQLRLSRVYTKNYSHALSLSIYLSLPQTHFLYLLISIKYTLGLSFYQKFTGKSVKNFYRFTGKIVSVNSSKHQLFVQGKYTD